MIVYDPETGWCYIVLFRNFVVCFRQLIISTGSGYLKEDTFTLPKRINKTCMSACVQKLGIGTSPALDRATTYYRIISENEIIVGLEDGHAELNEGESQTVSVIILGYEA